MAKLTNPLFLLSGTIGDLVFRRGRNGNVIVSSRPRRRTTQSPHQKKITSTFARAVSYAKAQMTDPIAKAECESRGTIRHQSGYLVALSDYLKDPSVRHIDVSRYHGMEGDIIAINPDSDITSVHVIITWKDMRLEHGEAEARGVYDAIGTWHYITMASNQSLPGSKITAILRDATGKSTILEKVL